MQSSKEHQHDRFHGAHQKRDEPHCKVRFRNGLSYACKLNSFYVAYGTAPTYNGTSNNQIVCSFHQYICHGLFSFKKYILLHTSNMTCIFWNVLVSTEKEIQFVPMDNLKLEILLPAFAQNTLGFCLQRDKKIPWVTVRGIIYGLQIISESRLYP